MGCWPDGMVLDPGWIIYLSPFYIAGMYISGRLHLSLTETFMMYITF